MDSQKAAIVLGVSVLLLIILGFLLRPGSSNGSGSYGKNGSGRQIGKNGASPSSGNAGSSSAFGQGSGGYGAGGEQVAGSGAGYSGHSSGGSRSSSGHDSSSKKTYSEEEMRELRRQRQEKLDEVYARKVKWLREQIDNESLAKKSRYRYRLQLLEGYRAGNDAFNNKDYAEALKQYMAALKDPDASTETKFTCLTQMRMTAKMLQDYDLYLELLKQQAQLIEDEDLSMFGIPKGKKGWPLYHTRRRFIMAIKEPDGFEKAIKELTPNDPLGLDSDEIRQQFEAELKEFKEDFEGTRAMLEEGLL